MTGDAAGSSPLATDADGREFVFRDITWTREELAEFEVWHATGAPDLDESVIVARNRARRVCLWAALCIAFVVAGIAVSIELEWSGASVLLLCVLLPIVLILLANFVDVVRGQTGIKRWILGGVVFRPPQVAVVRVTPEGVTTTTDAGTVFVSWSSYAKIELTTLLVVSRTYDRQYGAIPRRVVGEGEKFDRIHGTIVRWFREAGGGRPEPTLEMLAKNDVGCKRCGYNLRGIDKLVCPECGRELDLVDL